ncbi:MAG: hypothetical protein R6T96_15410, partial [Longimicrobiales bacterium]
MVLLTLQRPREFPDPLPDLLPVLLKDTLGSLRPGIRTMTYSGLSMTYSGLSMTKFLADRWGHA